MYNYLSSESAQLVKKAENKPYQLPKAKAEVYLTIFPGLVQRKPHYRTHTLFRMISQQFFGCVEWKSVHGPGDVHHEYVFPRWVLRRLNPLRWFNHSQKNFFILTFKQQQSRLYFFAHQAIIQNKIPITTECLQVHQDDFGYRRWRIFA